MIARIVLLLLGITIGVGSTYYFGSNYYEREHIRWLEESQEKLNNAIQQAGINYDALQSRYNDLRAQTVLDKAMVSQYDQEILMLREENSSLHEQLAFYEELIPAGGNGALSIKGFDAQLKGSHIDFRVLLYRTGISEQNFKGRLQFVATGLKQGKKTTMTLYPEVQEIADEAFALSNEAPTLKPTSNLKLDELSPILDLNFDRIQRSQGLLVVPFGFTPQELTVKILEGNSVRLSRTLSLQ